MYCSKMSHLTAINEILVVNIKWFHWKITSFKINLFYMFQINVKYNSSKHFVLTFY